MVATIDIILITIYFLAILIVGYLSSIKKSRGDYIIGSKKIGVLHNIATLTATKVTASIIITYVALVYAFGIGAIWIFIGAALGYLLFLFFAMKLKREGDRNDYYSMADYFYHRYGNFTGKLATILVMLILFLNFTIQIIGGSIILKNLLGLSLLWSVLLIAGVILFYLYVGGFKAVVKTDIVQFVSIILLSIVLGIFLFTNFSYEPAQWNLLSPGIGMIVAFFLVGILFPFSAPDLWQRVFAAKSVRALKKSFILTTIIYILFGVLLSIIAITIKLKLPGINADSALVQGFTQLLPSGLLGLGLITLFAAIMSSADSFAFVCAGLFMHDLAFRGKEHDKVASLKYGVLITIFLGCILAILFKSILSASYLLAGLFMVFSVVIIATWIKYRIRSRTINYGLIIGLLITIAFGLAKGISSTLVLVGVVGGIVGMLVGFFVSKVLKR